RGRLRASRSVGVKKSIFHKPGRRVESDRLQRRKSSRPLSVEISSAILGRRWLKYVFPNVEEVVL
ncbi:MAG TPA: hypothetical protein VE843_16980, partial [Ktedonobacteraceae bacterium]|nr:hypothetical protein [Ktedonobacteraceae bacterium]